MYTIKNEYEQILLQRAMRTSAFTELSDDLALLVHRFDSHGFSLPHLFYTDNCCEDRKLITSILHGGIRNEVTTIRESELPNIDFPEGKEPIYINVKKSSPEVLQIACQRLRNSGENNTINQVVVLGLDIEWNCSFFGTDNRPATVQLSAMDGTTFLFHLKADKHSGPIMPPSLRSLLQCSEIHLTGANIKGDMTRLKNTFDLEISSDRVHDIWLTAQNRKVHCPGKSLKDIVAQCLGKNIVKASSLRLSDWHQPLSQEQIKYASLDAFASILCYKFIMTHGDASFDTPTLSSFLPGTRVILYSKGQRGQAVASGEIVDPHAYAAYSAPGTGKLTSKKAPKVVVIGKNHQRHYVRIDHIKVSAYKTTIPTATIKQDSNSVTSDHLEYGDIVLWDAKDLRLPKPKPATKTVIWTEPNLAEYTTADDTFFEKSTPINTATLELVPGGCMELVTDGDSDDEEGKWMSVQL